MNIQKFADNADSTITDSFTKGVMLLGLSVMGNYVGQILNCKTQKLLKKNMMAKHIVMLLILIFAVDFSSSSNSKYPTDTIATALMIYIFYLLYSKMSMIFISVVTFLLFIVYLLMMYKSYYKDNADKNKKYANYISKIDEVDGIIKLLIILLTVIGFVLYFIKQRNDHYKNWSTTTFIFGSNVCDSMN